MRRLSLTMIAGMSALLIAQSAWAKSIGRSADIHRPFDAVYAAVSNYFSPDSMHDFQIVSRSKTEAKAEFVAKRTVQDQLKWSEWAYCKVPAMQLLDTLQQGNITVTVKLERAGAAHTYVKVTPDFQGAYEFAGNSSTRECVSNGVLEKDILRGAGTEDSDLKCISHPHPALSHN